MKHRLLSAFPLASLLFAVLLFPASDVLLAQDAQRADSLKASSSSERDDRGSSTAREADSRRARGASRPSDGTRARTPTRSRVAPPDRPATRRDGRAPTVRPDERDRPANDGVNDGRRDDRQNDRSDDRRDRDDDRRSDRSDDRRESNDRRNRDYDDRRDRHYDGRQDRHYDGRQGRHYDDRRDRGRDRRHEGGGIVIHPPHHGAGWVRPYIEIDIDWPWVHRHERRWSPRYRYRQSVYVDAGWGRHRRESRLDLRTYYRHRVQDASSRRAIVDVVIDRIEIYEDGFFVGEVHHIPDDLARMRAVVDRRGGVRFDRDVFLLGDPYAGFEIISTRHYDGFVLNHYRASHGVRAGALDLRRERVVRVRRSRFFDPHDFSGFVPINLLPDDAGWLIDYGYDSYSGHYWGDDDRYYYGFSSTDDYVRYDDDRVNYDTIGPRGETSGRESSVYFGETERAPTTGRSDTESRSSRVTPERQALQRSADRTFETESGAKIRLKRESSIERVD